MHISTLGLPDSLERFFIEVANISTVEKLASYNVRGLKMFVGIGNKKVGIITNALKKIGAVPGMETDVQKLRRQANESRSLGYAMFAQAKDYDDKALRVERLFAAENSPTHLNSGG